jgi:hypothetical protein
MFINGILVEFKNTYIVVPIIITLAVLGVYIKSLIVDYKIEKEEYINASVIAGISALFVVYVNKIKHTSTESILHTPPPF